MIKLSHDTDCTGCSACANACHHDAINMVANKEGFYVPQIDIGKCTECGLCTLSCPVLHPKSRPSLSEPRVFAAHHQDLEIRKRSSSGGIFTAIANQFIKEDSCVVGAAFDEHLVCRHTFAFDENGLAKMRGSKYVQSQQGTIYKEIKQKLNEGIRVLYVGTPCQVAGLYSFLPKQYENLFTIDLVCHGVPSPGLFKTYLAQIGIDTDKIWENYHFRDLSHAGCYFTSAVVNKHGRKKKIKINKHSYITAYLKGWLHRPSCYHCRFNGIPRQADITMGDFWGIISGKVPFNGIKKNGLSVVLVNTEKGAQLLSKVSNHLYLEEKRLSDAIVDNPNLIESDKVPEIRGRVYEELSTLSPKAFMKKYNLYLPHITLYLRVRYHVKLIIRTLLKK